MDRTSDLCMSNNGKDRNNTRHMYIRVHLVRNVENFKMNNTEFCEGYLHLEEISAKNFGESGLNLIMKYIMARIEN